MKKCFRIFLAVVAMLAAAVSCQKVEEISEAPKTTHTVKFTTDLPTKTSYDIEGTTVNYKWEDSDLNRLHVYEDGVEGTIDVEKSAINETRVLLTVDFEGSAEGIHTYTANLNEGIIKSNQVADGKYDSDCDVLVAKPVSSLDVIDGIYTFRFRRPVAITELKLKGLKAGEEVSKVTILSGTELVGKYTQDATDDTKGEWSDRSNKITVTFGEGETKTVDSDGSLIVPIVSMPLENASVKVLVKTESGLKYRKVTSSALTLTANNVKVQGIGMTQVTEAEHAEDGWYLVTDASELFDGDEIRIAGPEKGMIAGEFAIVSEETKEYLTANTATFTLDTFEKLTGVDSENRPNTFTLEENYNGSFALVNENGKLGTTSASAMSYDDGTGCYSGVTDWSIVITDNLATISTGESYGRILCNASSTRFRNYTSKTSASMLLPHLYKKYGDAQDPIMKTARTASFSPATATVTIDAGDNVFPELSFTPAEATDGLQTWTSSDTDVATVNETTGEVTLVSDGTTTISVEIAETDTYQPCGASYELTVKPAPVQGLDIIDNDFVGNPTSYTSWKDKVATNGSGNTYAGQSTTQSKTNNIQMRATTPSGIVVTASGSGKVARKVSVVWDDGTASGRKVTIYGKNDAYSGINGAGDLYSDETKGTELGSIVYNTSTELTITEDYEYIGVLPVGGALYVENISIQWEDGKPAYEACFKDAGGTVVTEVNATVGEVFTAPTLYKGATPGFANAYESSNTEVATVDETGKVTLVKKGDAVITATLNGDDTHKTTEVSYTIHVANKLSSIKLADDSEQPTTFYVGQDFSFTGIKVEATYSDGEEKTLTYADLTSDNFSGFDSSAAVESQTITVSYTDNSTTKTTTYDVEIKPSVTLYGITVPEPVVGNSITVKGGLTKAPEGDEIELDVNLAAGYKLTSLKVNDVEHSSDVAEGKYTFTMPAAAVTVTAVFDNHYNVTIEQPIANGTVKVQNATASSQSIAYGTSVSVLAEPADGYEFDSWTVTGATLADATSASTSFTMPANDVNITASFKKHVETQKITITASSVTNFEASYKAYTWSQNGVSGNMYAYMGGSTGSYNMQFNKTTYVYNSNAVPGRIKSITMTKVSGTTRSWSVYVGTSALTSTTGATQVESAKNVESETKWTVNSGDYYYFYLTKADGGTNIGSIVIEYEPGDVPAVDASWEVNPVSVKVGDDKTTTITTNYNGTLSVSSNNTSIATATISGKTITVHGVAEGNTTLTVTGAATTAFNAINKTIDVTVNPAGGSDPVTVTWVAQNASDNPGDAKDWFSGSIDANISWAATKGGSNNPKYYDTGTGLRVYNGGTFTVSAANGKKITKIILTFSGTSYTFSSSNATTPQTYDLSSVESKQWEVSRTCRLQKVEVTYE